MSATAPELMTPGRGRGLLDVFRNRYLLKLLVDKEIKVRYRGTVLGLLWSYLKPAVQFFVYYIAMGIFLELEKGLENFAIYLFSGIVLMNLFGEIFGNASRSMTDNGGLLKKIYLPRQLFPVANVFVALVHFVPQLLILLIACLTAGWHPSPVQFLCMIAGFCIVAIFALGLGMVFATLNVFFRDAENFVDLILMVATWASPVLYPFTRVVDKLPEWVYFVYFANPLTVAVELFHYAFWFATTELGQPQWHVADHLLTFWTPFALLIALATLFVGDLLFRRQEGNFAQEL